MRTAGVGGGEVLTGICAAAVLVFALLMTAFSILPHPRYTPDGIAYARFAARDAGYSERDATLAARAFYEATPLMSIPRYRALVEIDPSVAFARSHIFANRMLYPWIASLGLHAVGFRSLFYVSAISYVLFGAALFWMLGVFERPILAAGVTIAVLTVPVVREVASSDLTDMFAMVWWVLAFGALLRLLRSSSTGMLALLACSSVLFALTRPTPYLIVLPALAVVAVRAPKGSDALRGSLWALAASICGLVAYFAVAAMTHAYGVSEQLRWVYANESGGTSAAFSQWYRSSLFTTLRFTAVQSVRTVVPVVLVVALIYGLTRERSRNEMIVIAAAVVACVLSIPFNPVPSAIARVVLLPIVPLFGAVAVGVIALLSPRAVPAVPKAVA